MLEVRMILTLLENKIATISIPIDNIARISGGDSHSVVEFRDAASITVKESLHSLTDRVNRLMRYLNGGVVMADSFDLPKE